MFRPSCRTLLAAVQHVRDLDEATRNEANPVAASAAYAPTQRPLRAVDQRLPVAQLEPNVRIGRNISTAQTAERPEVFDPSRLRGESLAANPEGRGHASLSQFLFD